MPGRVCTTRLLARSMGWSSPPPPYTQTAPSPTTAGPGRNLAPRRAGATSRRRRRAPARRAAAHPREPHRGRVPGPGVELVAVLLAVGQGRPAAGGDEVVET